MFHRMHWARVFANVLGGDADEGLACLKAMAGPVKTIPGKLSGHADARRLETMLRHATSGWRAVCATEHGVVPCEPAVEYVIRFISLLVEKNHFRDIDSIMYCIEEKLDADKGIVRVRAETACAMDTDFEQALRQGIIEKTGTAQVKMQTLIVPELLGGFRLQIGGYYIDASLKGQMAMMQAELESAILCAAGGGE